MREIRLIEVASQFVEGLDYPIAKAEIATAARDANIDRAVLDSLKTLPDREYSDPEDLTQALNAAG